MKNKVIDEKKTKYFVIAIILLIILSVILVIHFNNKSLVNGDEEKVTTTTTTETITTTKKKSTKKRTTKKVEEVIESPVVENVIYKSSIDEENKLVYNYKLTEEITDTDVIISKVLTIDETLKNNNVISLYDISLYDANLTKKTVKNSAIEISIPLGKELLGYDEYKIIYINDNNEITDEKIESIVENEYIKFTTNHLSIFGIVATKKEVVEEPKEEIEVPKDEVIEVPKDEESEEMPKEEITVDLTNVNIDVKINDAELEENNFYVNTSDKVSVEVTGIEEYELYYLLKDEENINEYEKFKNNIFEDIKTPNKYTLVIKVVVGEESKVFEIGTVNIYDIVFEYDKNAEVKEDIVKGEIKDENGIESTYEDKNTNQNIVIDVKEESEELVENEEINTNVTDNVQEESSNVVTGETSEETTPEGEENLPEETPEEDVTEPEDVAKIILKGNVYLVEETDISALEITGHLIIDTKEDVRFGTNEDKLLTSNIYTITIQSKEFSINGVKYTYEFKDSKLIISRINELEEKEEVAKEDFENMFDGFKYNEDSEELVLGKEEVDTELETETETASGTVTDTTIEIPSESGSEPTDATTDETPSYEPSEVVEK